MHGKHFRSYKVLPYTWKLQYYFLCYFLIENFMSWIVK